MSTMLRMLVRMSSVFRMLVWMSTMFRMLLRMKMLMRMSVILMRILMMMFFWTVIWTSVSLQMYNSVGSNSDWSVVICITIVSPLLALVAHGAVDLQHQGMLLVLLAAKARDSAVHECGDLGEEGDEEQGIHGAWKYWQSMDIFELMVKPTYLCELLDLCNL